MAIDLSSARVSPSSVRAALFTGVFALTSVLGLGGCDMFYKAADCNALADATSEAEKLIDGVQTSAEGSPDDLRKMADAVEQGGKAIEGKTIRETKMMEMQGDLVKMYAEFATDLRASADKWAELEKKVEADPNALSEMEQWGADFEKQMNDYIARDDKLIDEMNGYCQR
jgi:hypothetical protein